MGQGVSQNGPSERYFLQKVKLGEGSFGTVWRAVDRHTNNIVAVKQLDKAVLPKRGVRRCDIEREISVMQAVDHENVTKLFDTWEDAQSIFLALEYCNGGDFGDKVREKGMQLEEAQAAQWMYQIISAIWVLHCKNICHRDIKPDNFMVHHEVLKLSDFGLAVHLPWGQRLMDKCGTPAFMSPEQHQLPRDSPGYSHACDVWAAGITMYMVMFAGKHPFLLSSQQLDQNALLNGQLDFTVNSGFFNFASKDRYSNTARIFCKQMVTTDAPRRISAMDARQSIWFQEQGIGRVKKVDVVDVEPNGTPERLEEPAPPECKEPVGWWPFVPEKTELDKPVPTEVETPEVSRPEPPNELQQQIQDLELKLRRLHGENMMQKQQNESQFQMLLEMQEQLKKQVTQDLEATMAAAPKVVEVAAAPMVKESSPAQPSSTRPPRKLQTAATAVVVETLPANQTVAKGMRCRYWSSTHGGRWLPATVARVNESTIDLDIKQHAAIENISPTPDAAEAEAWPPGTSVSYNSSTAKRWIPAVVQSFNSANGSNPVGSYNLDVRPQADCEKIRPRMLKPSEIIHVPG